MMLRGYTVGVDTKMYSAIYYRATFYKLFSGEFFQSFNKYLGFGVLSKSFSTIFDAQYGYMIMTGIIIRE